jgi:hypothetical protein
MADSQNVTNDLCDARMANIETKLSAINETTTRIEGKLNEVSILYGQIPLIVGRVEVLEKWKDKFSLSKILLIVSGIAVSITTIYDFLKKIMIH